jgi:hypothetical protein
MRARSASWLYFLGSIVPAALSFLLFRLVRSALKKAKLRYISRHPESCKEWQLMNAEFVRKPLVLPLIMTGAPRWNPHALIGTVGPIAVKNTIALHAPTARASAGEWFFVIYSHPDHKTIGSLSSLTDSGAEWEFVSVPRAGQYTIGARYYHPQVSLQFPEIRIDNASMIPSKRGSPDANAFYSELRQRENIFYRSLQYYIYAMLRCRDWFSRDFVQREFLPVGNPETEFVFGPIRAGEPLILNFDPRLFETTDIYVTIYSRCSFPIAWFELTASSLREPCIAQEAGFYLMRMQKKKLGFATSILHDSSIAATR